MKLLTLNTHSLHSENSQAYCQILCNTIREELPDVVALQEVNQFMNSSGVFLNDSYVAAGDVPIKEGNYAVLIHEILKEMNLRYNFCWMGMKKGYDKFDEGLAIFSRAPIKEAKSLLLSNTADYNNFKKRMALLVETDFGVFINCHLGWEHDLEEPFQNQLIRINACQNFKKEMYLMGDFNVRASGEGYERITSSGWHDTFCLAEEKCGEATVSGKIDGWEKNGGNLRIDYIFTNKKKSVKKSQVLFDGKKEPKISDHFGVMVTI